MPAICSSTAVPRGAQLVAVILPAAPVRVLGTGVADASAQQA